MKLHILLSLALAIVFLFFVSRCSLNCPPSESEDFLNPSHYLNPPLSFNDHPVLRRHQVYQYTLPPSPSEGVTPDVHTPSTSTSGDVSYHTKCVSQDGSTVCHCVQCDGKTCTSNTCPGPDNSSALICCQNPSECTTQGCTPDATCDYTTWCGSNPDGGDGGGDDGGMSDKIWIVVGVSVLAAIAIGVAFYFWKTTAKPMAE